MPNKIANRVKMTVSGTPGTGTITLGSPVAGFQSFAGAGVSNSDTVPYVIEDGSAWELGVGTYTATGTSLSRSVTASSNSGNPINATSAAIVMISPLAADLQSGTAANNLVRLDGSSKLPVIDGSALTGVVASSMAASGLTGTLGVASGGTGLSSLASGRIPYGNGTGAFGSSSGFVFDGSNLTVAGSITANTGLTINGANAYLHGYNYTATDGSGYWAAGSSTYTCGWYGSSGAMIFRAGGTTTRLTISSAGSTVVGSAALATSATDGFFYIPTCAGAPTGTPTAYTGRVAMIYDTTNNNFYIYNGAWKKVAMA